MDEYNSVIAEYDRLCEERNNNRFWAENIMEATQNISCRIVWQNFYAYLANIHHVYTDTWQNSLGELVDQGMIVKQEGQTFKTKTVHNGNVTYIRMTPDNLLSSSKDGKSLASTFKTIPEEESIPEFETGDEKSEC